MALPKQIGAFIRAKGTYLLLHCIILALSVLLVVMISVDTFKGVEFYAQDRFEHVQFWVCIAFMADFFIELFMAKNKTRYVASRFIFLLVSIPYQAIIFHFGWHLSNQVAYLIRYMPLIRGGYAMAIVVSWFTNNRATGLFFSYIITLLSTVYFASLTFYLFEQGVNPLVTKYTDALWWAAMDVTTVGSNIVAVTGVGRVLSVLLAALGMMMFPIFTVYVTNVITRINEDPATETDPFLAFKNYVKAHPGANPSASTPTPTPDSNKKQ